ncbi:hypothetical protein QUF74_05535 [Candidatus Halobeggiatoa sp. HSG11]|nr:hypothetical protein [Candidatus Halobeggiatoa sp. HSG11]
MTTNEMIDKRAAIMKQIDIWNKEADSLASQILDRYQHDCTNPEGWDFILTSDHTDILELKQLAEQPREQTTSYPQIAPF